MKKNIIPLVIVFVLAALCIYMSCSVKSEFKLFYVVNGFASKNDALVTAKDLQSEYYISGKHAKEVCENPNDYFTVYISCSSKNNSISTVFNLFNAFSNNKNIFVSKEMPESTPTRFINAHDKSWTNTISLLVKKDKLNELENLKFKRVYIGFLGLSFSTLKFSGMMDIEEFVVDVNDKYGIPENPLDFMSDDELNDFFSVSAPKDKEYIINDYPIYSAVRYDKKCFYKIRIDEKRRCAVALFDVDGSFTCGALISAFLPSETPIEIINGKTTLEDIRMIDNNCFLFPQGDNKYKTYLYFDDGSYFEISYTYDGKNYIVESHKECSYKNICDVLISEDKAYLEKTYGIKFKV